MQCTFPTALVPKNINNSLTKRPIRAPPRQANGASLATWMREKCRSEEKKKGGKEEEEEEE